VAVAWRGRPGMATALAHLARIVARPRRSRCIEWEAAAGWGHGTTAALRGRLRPAEVVAREA
jgi:hypothetical protein